MKQKNALRKTGKVLLWIIGIWAALLVVLQIVLSSSLTTRIVNGYAERFVDGDISFGKVSVSMFRHFPSIGITLEDFSITYPADRFDESEQAGVQGHLMWKGCGETADTLARFEKFTAGLNVAALVTGSISVPYLDLVQPRIFIHNYADGRSNLDIFKFGESTEDEEDESSGMPKIRLGKINFTRHPHVVFTDCRDTVFAMIDFKQLVFNGRLDTGRMSRNKLGLDLDSMFIAGRVVRDTLALGMDRLHIDEHNKHMDLSAKARTFVATRMFGRMKIPVEINAGLSFPKDSVPVVSLEHFDISVASIPLHGRADVRLHTGSTYINGDFMIDRCELDPLLKDIVSHFVPEAEKISTDATLSLSAACDGYYTPQTGELPQFSLNVSVPDSRIAHSDISRSLTIGLEAEAGNADGGAINVSVNKAAVKTAGLFLNAKASAEDVLAKDPRIKVDGNFKAVLDTLASVFLPDSLNIVAKGSLEASVNGSARLSQLDMYNFSKADLKGEAICRNVIVESPDDSLDVFIDKLEMKLGPEIKKGRKDPSRTMKLLTVTGTIDSTYISYGNAFEVIGNSVVMTAKNSSSGDSTKVSPLGVRLNAKMLRVKDSEGSAIALDNTENGFLLYPKKEHREIPVMTVTSKNKRIFLKSTTNRVILTDASVKATAAMNTIERKQRAKAMMDSLARVYPDVPKDSLFIHARQQRASKPLPDWMKEDDFKKQDPNLKLDQTLAKYFREWDLNGNIDVRTGILMTPYFPLRNILKGCGISFDNNRISIDTLAVAAGESKIAAKGSLTGIKRALLGRNGTLKLDVDITSDGMNANELLKAYSTGSKYTPPRSGELESVSDAEFLKMVTAGNDEAKDSISLVVIPGNINADISVDARNIKYSDLAIEQMTANMIMKERCIQVTDTKAITNAGDISFDGFYSTRSKKDLKAGFDINMTDITAEKVIALMPAVDSLMPMLKSFRGLLNCELAATADLDTNMNIVMPSINGVMRIGGEHLTISDNELFRTLAKKLLFKNKKTGFIDKMTVEGVVKDNVLEVFPFVLKVDRYTLAMSGIQNLDMSFRYHVSVLKSPILIRLGIDLYGQDFDHLKFKIGKPKYKNTNVPVFSSVIDDTKINLLQSIKGIFEKGVEAAINENNRQMAIEDKKKELGYVNAADQELEPLSEKEQQQLEAEEAAEKAEEASGNVSEESSANAAGESSEDGKNDVEK
ncbi:MAG: hypothetical protein ACI3ZS_09310 [Candidatus Cryptobacteroides sp.]